MALNDDVENRGWGRLIDEHLARQMAEPPRSVWPLRIGRCLVVGFVGVALLVIANLVVDDVRVSSLPPGAARAAHFVCPVPGGNVDSITKSDGRYNVSCSLAPFGWPRGTGSMECVDGEWVGTGFEYGSPGVACTGQG